MWFKSNWINHPQNHQRWVLKPKVHYIIHQPQIHPKTSKNHKDISHSQIYPFNSSAAGGWPTASPASLPTLSPGLTEQASRTSGRGTSWRVRSSQGRPKMMPWGPTRRFMRWAKKWLGSWLIDDDRKLWLVGVDFGQTNEGQLLGIKEKWTQERPTGVCKEVYLTRILAENWEGLTKIAESISLSKQDSNLRLPFTIIHEI